MGMTCSVADADRMIQEEQSYTSLNKSDCPGGLSS